MSAPKGNQYALENEGGRPPYFDSANDEDVAKVKQLCENYFENLPKDKPPTITGLSLHLGFDSKNTLYEYGKKQVFSDSIKRASMKIEQFHEEAAAMGDKCTGNIFILKNFGWEDKQNVDHTTKGKAIQPNSTKVVFKKFNDE